MHGNRCFLVENLIFSVDLARITIPRSSKRLNVARGPREATVFYYSHLNVRGNVN